MLEVYSKPFEQLDSYHLLVAYLQKRGLFIMPKVTILGREPDGKLLTAQYVPLSKTLELFLALPGVLKTVKDNFMISNCDDGYLKSFLDGDLWKEKKKKFVNTSKKGTILPFMHYYDDFETCNPLGSKAGLHKLGGNYSVLLALPPRFNSALENLFLSSLFYSSDRTGYSNNICYSKVIEEFDDLAKNGKLIFS